MDLDYIRKHYETLDDSKLKSLATHEAHTLRPEVIPVLMEEIKRRNLSETILQGMETQLKEPTEAELSEYCTILQNLSCPVCKSKTGKLNAVTTKEVISMIVVSTKRESLRIACTGCLQNFKSKANSRTALLGWWSPIGFFNTVFALVHNSKINGIIHGPTELLISYAYANRGAIEAGKQNPKQLVNLLERTNDQ